MTDVLWAMIVGPLMWLPGVNIVVGILAFGWAGGLMGLLITLVIRFGGGNEQVKRTGRATARKVQGWWTVLGVTPNASRDEINEAYRRKAKSSHPDVGGSAEMMAKINAARDAALRQKSN